MIIIIYIIIKIFFKSQKVVYVMPANTEQIVAASSLGSVEGTTNNCTYSIWFYVNDWSVNYGEEKVIFQRSSKANDVPDLSLYLGSYEQSLSVRTAIKSKSDVASNFVSGINEFIEGGPEAGKIPNWCNGGKYNPTEGGATEGYCWYTDTPITQTTDSKELEKYNIIAMYNCNKNDSCLGYSYKYDGGWAGISYYKNLTDPTDTEGSKDLTIVPKSGSIYGYKLSTQVGYKICTIPNIELQKWNNVILSATTNTMDIYINGNLAQSCDLGGEINILNSGNVYLSPNNKGFNGWNSKFQFWNYEFNPAQAKAVYRKGHGGANTGALDYKLNVTLFNGSSKQGSINI